MQTLLLSWATLRPRRILAGCREPERTHSAGSFSVAFLLRVVGMTAVFGAAVASNGQAAASAAPITINILTDHPGARINPAIWGIFFEDINFGADGGLYAELVKNRGFEFPTPLMG